ncbi:FRG domain-containing protein [Brevundimonas aurantiaca]|jgi:hypothetical protein|uniref:FRG domain-containing protein n=1 Tax=Brevundimonas aurantiaca TaxID=74316 RepID=A0A7W9C3G8_9CAUL|nr:FRG domain-containing protein [Brevundimonas aurantiaca]MBB5738420.1 hypothetical protein [Brevundimonas aurantiaca]
MDISVGSAAEAVAKCQELLVAGRVNFFRGQTHDWPKLLPSLSRRDGEEKVRAAAELAAFLEWAQAVPQMASYWSSMSAMIAIAQHYSVPTTFLDLTTSPEVALLFSKTEGENPPNSRSVIYCFPRDVLEIAEGVEIVEIDVSNLWRLEAQHGLFINVTNEDALQDLREKSIRIHFPSEKISDVEKIKIYPTRKSALEIVIDQWIYRNTIDNVFHQFRSSATVWTGIKRNTYPGAFRWRTVPELLSSWIDDEQNWLVPTRESVSSIEDVQLVSVAALDLSSPTRAIESARAAIAPSIRDFRSGGPLPQYVVTLANSPQHDASVSTIVNRCWDGLRVLPYRLEELIESLCLTVAVLAGRAEGVADIDDWPKHLWGEVELIDAAPVGGHLEAAPVSKAMLYDAAEFPERDRFTKYMKRRARSDKMAAMDLVVDPWLIFDFEKLKHLFVTQFVPMSIDGFWKSDLEECDGKLECMWSISFNPALLGFVTNSRYRFNSPSGLEPQIDRVIYVAKDMSSPDLEEAFLSCMPIIIRKGEPFNVKFIDYSMDDRPIWEIPKAIEQCRRIVEIGGISVLRVFSTINFNDEPEEDHGHPGLGAFEVWLIAKGKLAAMQGKALDPNSQLFKNFYADLLKSNRKIDRKAEAASDWPGAV